MTVADPLSPDWLPPVVGVADVPDPSPRHLSMVPEPVPPAVFDAIARLVPAPRPAVAPPVVAPPVAAPPVAAPRVAIPSPTPAADAELDGYTLRQMVLAELRSLARGE
ncbi:MAG: hypothetical protein Q8R60_03655 [Mycobacteriales bacterium]|nr:hypothetical protein [Mycobacteriales bacterium]